ncbi:cyanate transporter [Kaistia granuli]|uniref:cyanate transporter n=1 Tax=Kaistia granuli TaxID=363259 RepID=UPI0003741DAD|nr:cyanate transporter [Kaistia granuli]
MTRIESPKLAGWLLLGAVAMVGLNLRPFLTAVGPLASGIRHDTGLDLQGMALLTLVPMLLMGVFAFAGPYLQRILGARRAVLVALAILGVGSLLRLFAGTGAALLGTAALCGLGVAIVQAVFPGIIKQQFPQRVTAVTGLYSSMLMVGGALGAQIAPIVATVSGSWRVGLAWIALPAVVAIAMAARLLPRDPTERPLQQPISTLLKRPRTWLLMACFGLVNGGYSSIVAWLAPAYQEAGWSGAASGGLMAIMAASQAVAALLVPMLAARGLDRRPWIWLALSMQIAGFAGLGLWPVAAPVLWAVLVGAGLGSGFALLMVVALDHLRDPAQAGALSALMQGGGFLIAAIPPWIVAVAHDLTGSFAAGWFLHLGCAALVAVLVVRLAPEGYATSMRVAGSAEAKAV